MWLILISMTFSFVNWLIYVWSQVYFNGASAVETWWGAMHILLKLTNQ